MPFQHYPHIMSGSYGKGILFAFSAYLIWGFLPLYWRALAEIRALHLLGFRIVLSLVFVAAILFACKRFSWILFFKDRRRGFQLVLASLTVTFNWGLFIWAVNAGRSIEASLGYYINPMVVVVIGLFFFKEKLVLMQKIAVVLALTGVLTLTILSGTPPWISFALAFCFSIYSLLKKNIDMPAFESLAVETLITTPFGLLLFFVPGVSYFFTGESGIGYMAELPRITLLILFFCGFATTMPLYFFTRSAQLLPLSTLGFIQFLSPTMTFLIGFFVFGEYFPWYNFIAFGFIWAAVIMYIASLYVAPKRK